MRLQLLCGIRTIQKLPAVIIGLYTRWFNAWAPLIGWAVRTVLGTAMAASVNFAAMYPLAIGGCTFPSYIALATPVLNLIVAAVLTPVFNAIAHTAADVTLASDYAM
jgi:SSS family solute:Na+ symporter